MRCRWDTWGWLGFRQREAGRTAGQTGTSQQKKGGYQRHLHGYFGFSTPPTPIMIFPVFRFDTAPTFPGLSQIIHCTELELTGQKDDAFHCSLAHRCVCAVFVIHSHVCTFTVLLRRVDLRRCRRKWSVGYFTHKGTAFSPLTGGCWWRSSAGRQSRLKVYKPVTWLLIESTSAPDRCEL